MKTFHFYDLTYLLDYYKSEKYIKRDDLENYELMINKLINSDKKFKVGDVLFVGSNYESRQYYGFTKIIKSKKSLMMGATFENPSDALTDIQITSEVKEWFYKTGKHVLGVDIFEEAF